MLVLSKWILHSTGAHSCGAHSPFSMSVFIHLRIGEQLKSSNWCQFPLLSISLSSDFPLVNKYHDWLPGLPSLTVWSLVLIFFPLCSFKSSFSLWSCQKAIQPETSFPIPALSSLFQFSFLSSPPWCIPMPAFYSYSLPNSFYTFLSFVIQSVSHHFLQIKVVSSPVSSSFSFPHNSLLLSYLPSSTHCPRVDHTLFCNLHMFSNSSTQYAAFLFWWHYRQGQQ